MRPSGGASHLAPSRQPAGHIHRLKGIVWALLVAALLTALAAPAGSQPRTFAIERFAVTLEVGADATLRVREAITVDFRGAHQGFFRTIPVRYERRGLEFATR